MALGMSIRTREVLSRLLDGVGALGLVRREISLVQKLIFVGLPLLGYGKGIMARVAEALVYKIPGLAWVLALWGVMGVAPWLVIITACHNEPPRMPPSPCVLAEVGRR